MKFRTRHAENLSDPYIITPNDTTDEVFAFRGLYIGGTGDVTIVRPDGVAVLFKACPTGMILPVVGTRVKATGTTATNLVGM